MDTFTLQSLTNIEPGGGFYLEFHGVARGYSFRYAQSEVFSVVNDQDENLKLLSSSSSTISSTTTIRPISTSFATTTISQTSSKPTKPPSILPPTSLQSESTSSQPNTQITEPQTSALLPANAQTISSQTTSTSQDQPTAPPLVILSTGARLGKSLIFTLLALIFVLGIMYI